MKIENRKAPKMLEMRDGGRRKEQNRIEYVVEEVQITYQAVISIIMMIMMIRISISIVVIVIVVVVVVIVISVGYYSYRSEWDSLTHLIDSLTN